MPDPIPPPPMSAPTMHDGLAAMITESKKAKKRRPVVATLAGVIGAASTALGGYGLHRSSEVDDVSRDRMVRVEERLANHMASEGEKHEDLTARTDRLEHSQRRMERKVDRQSATNDLVLDALNVPKKIRPAKVEEEDP